MATPIGPDFIAFQVRDLQASAKFYVDVFGFEPEPKSPPGAVLFKSTPIALALREPVCPLPETGPLGVGTVLWVACTDADALHNLIVQRGGTISKPVADSPFGRFFIAVDPDGYSLHFHTAKS